MHQSWFNKFKICFDGEKRRVDHIRVVGLYVRWSLDTFLTSSLPQELEVRFCVEMHTYRETASELVQTSIYCHCYVYTSNSTHLVCLLDPHPHHSRSSSITYHMPVPGFHLLISLFFLTYVTIRVARDACLSISMERGIPAFQMHIVFIQSAIPYIVVCNHKSSTHSAMCLLWTFHWTSKTHIHSSLD